MTDCIIWNKSKDRDGYGLTQVNGKMQYIHRVVYAQTYGVVLTRDDVIRHTCDNPSCFNLDHLRRGTHGDNVKDKVTKGRQAKGESLSLVMKTRKLNETQVRQIRRLYASDSWTQVELGEVFNIGKSVVNRILTGLAWKWLKGEVRSYNFKISNFIL